MAGATDPLYQSIYISWPRRLSTMKVVGRLKSIYAWNVLLFGLPCWALFNYGYFAEINFKGNEALSISVYLAALWIFVGPLLILAWEQSYERFVLRYRILMGEGPMGALPLHSWPRFRRTCGSGFVLLALSLFLMVREDIYSVISIDLWSFVFWTSAIVLAVAGYATGIGIAGVVYTTWLFLRLRKQPMPWSPYHPDGRGGLGFLADYAFSTAFCFVGGVTVVPGAMAIAGKVGGLGALAITATVAAYSLLIMLIFFLPMQIIYIKATDRKKETLGSIGRSLEDVVQEYIDCGTWESAPRARRAVKTSGIDVDRTIQLYDHVAKVSTVPFSMPTAVRVFGLALAPIAIGILQLLVERFLEQGFL